MSAEVKNDRKHKTSKSRRETAVQGTNDNSIVSKCSMAAQGYFDDDFLQCFVSKVTRRAPLIHRGYYIRAVTLDCVLQRFLDRHPGKKQIISLGAGFDSTYFRLKTKHGLEDVLFCEVDFPEVVKRKCAIIKSQSRLSDLIGEQCSTGAQKSSIIELSSAAYKLIGLDLGQLNTLDAALKLCSVDLDVPTLVLSECVLTYMTRRCASDVVQWAAETFNTAVFVLYEQINPSDSFGLFMKNHFINIGSPLKCIDSFPTIESQEQRFQQLGWEDCEVLDMNQSYNHLVSDTERDRIEHLEPFDEHEEWHLKCAHYIVLCGYHGNCKRLLSDVCQTKVLHAELDSLKCRTSADNLLLSPCKTASPLKRFGHGSVALSDRIVLTVGGFGEQNGKHMRVSHMTLTDTVTMETICIDPHINNRDIEVSRMHATLTKHEDGSLLLIGGRLSPLRLCTQIVKIDLKNCPRQLTPKVQTVVHGHKCNQCNREQFKENSGLGSKTNRVCSCVPLLKHNAVKERKSSKIADGTNSVLENAESKHLNVLDKELESKGESVELFNTNRTIPDAETSSSRKSDVNVNEAISVMAKKDFPHDSSEAPITSTESTEITAVNCSIVMQQGDLPCPRWRHSSIVCQTKYGESVVMFGGRTQTTLALDDCYIFTPSNNTWVKVTSTGEAPSARQSQTASLWNGHMIIAGGLGIDMLPLISVFMLNMESFHWTQVQTSILPRYSHTSHVINDRLILIGGTNFSHNPVGVAIINLLNGDCVEIPLPMPNKDFIYMLHGHTSVVNSNNKILVLGGGGNCFSFGTHLNSSPISINLAGNI